MLEKWDGQLDPLILYRYDIDIQCYRQHTMHTTGRITQIRIFNTLGFHRILLSDWSPNFGSTCRTKVEFYNIKLLCHSTFLSDRS